MLIRLALSELWAGRRRLWLPGISFSFSLAALYLLLSFETRVNASLENEGRQILGADLHIEAARPWRQDDYETLNKILPKDARVIEFVEFNTMLQAQESRLVRLQAIEQNYPFYGEFIFEGESFKNLNSEDRKVLIHNDLAETLKLKTGDQVRLGRGAFTVSGILKKRPASLGSLFGLAPPVWIHRRHLDASGLLERPGRVEWVFLIAVKSLPILELQTQLQNAFQDPMLRFRSYLEADRAFQNLYQRIRFFAQFVSILALLLSGLSVLGGLQNWFYERRLLVASLRVFGARKDQIRQWIFSSIACFAVVFCLLGYGLGRMAEVSLVPLLQELLPLSLERGGSWGSDLLFVLLSGVSILLFAGVAQSGVLDFRPLLLLRSGEDQGFSGPARRLWLLWFLGIVFLFFLMSLLILNSARQAAELTGGAVTLGFLALFVSRITFFILERLPRSKNFSWTYSLQSILRQGRSSGLAISILFCVSAILSLLLVLQSALKKDFELEEGVRSTVLFAFDVGEEEKEKIGDITKEFPDFEVRWAPWVRVKWLKKNGEELRVESSERLFDPTEFNVGVVRHLPADNRVVAGSFWSGEFRNDLPELSITRDFARQVGLELGDQMTLDLWGVRFEARVTSLRSVRWTDFQPNFRVLIQEGFLEGLPFSYVAGFKAKDLSQKELLYRRMMRELPAVSVIDLTEVKKNLVDLTGRLTWVLLFILLFLIGLAIVLVMALAQEKVIMRRREFAQLKALGARSSQVRKLLFMEYFWISVLPSVLGLGLGVFLAEFCLQYFFTMDPAEGFSLWLLSPLALGLLMSLIALMGSRALLGARPVELLSE